VCPMTKSEKAVVTGENGERAVAKLLRARGYRVDLDPLEDWDLLLDSFLTVEVKTAHKSGRTDTPQKRWQFCLYAHKDRQQPVNEDVLVLRCESEPPCHFIIPMLLVPPNLTKIDITSPDPWQYRGKWSSFRGRWEFVDMVMAYIIRHGRSW
jgi:hypothetical protein